METKEIRRIKSKEELPTLVRGDWVEVNWRDGKIEVMVIGDSSRRLELATEAEGGILYVDTFHNEIEITGGVLISSGQKGIYGRGDFWYDMLKSRLEAKN